MSFTAVDGKIVQVIKCIVAETRSFPIEKALRDLSTRLKAYNGWSQIYWYPTVNRPEILNICIVWESVAHANVFTASYNYLKIFSKNAIVAPKYIYFNLK